MTGNTTYRAKGTAVFFAALMVLSMVAMSATLIGGVAASNHDLDGNLSDETAAPGENVSVMFSVESAADTEEAISGYDVQVTWDPSVLDFQGVSDADYGSAPTVGNEENGSVTFNAVNINGPETPLDLANLEFDVVGSEGDVSDVAFDAGNSSFTADNDNTTWNAGSVEVGTAGPEFNVTDYSGPAEADEGEDVTGSATVENTGDENGTREIALDVWDGGSQEAVLDSESLQLDAGENSTVDLTGAANVAPGNYTLAITAWESDSYENSEGQAGDDFTVNEVTSDFSVSDLSPEDIAIEVGDTLDEVSATVTNDGNETDNTTVEWSVQDTNVSENQTVEIDAGNSTTVSFEDVDTSGIASGTYQHEMSAGDDSVNGNFTVADEERGVLVGDVRDENAERFDEAPNVTVNFVNEDTGEEVFPDDIELWELDQVDPGNHTLLHTAGWSEQDNAYSVGLSTFGGESEYTVTANHSAFIDFAGSQDVQSDATSTQDISMERLVPSELQVEPLADQARADGIDQVAFTVTAYSDQLDAGLEPVSGISIEANTPDDYPGFEWDEDEIVTDANGEAEFVGTSTEVQTVMANFTAPDYGLSTVDVSAEFVPAYGEGTVVGDVYDADSPDDRTLEDATVWATDRDTFLANGQSVDVPDEDGEYAFYRVVDNETGDILDVNQDYRIDNDGQNDALSITRVEFLNETNIDVGSGFAVRTEDAAATDMFVTPLESGEYYLERSDTAPSASDQRIGSDTDDAEDFVRVTPNGQSEINPLDAVWEVEEDLTADAATTRSDATGQNLIDLTDDHGKYTLSNLFTNFQAGEEYVIAATKGGYDTRYVDALVMEDGSFFMDGEDENFALHEVAQPAEYLDIENWATHEPVGVGQSIDFSAVDVFEDTSDEHAQILPRDGTLDLLNVTTRFAEDGDLTNGTAYLEVPSDAGVDDFDGEFIDVYGGDILDSGDGWALIHTGDEEEITDNQTLEVGEAIAVLQTDSAGEELVRADEEDNSGMNEPASNKTGIFGQIQLAPSVTDFSEKRFTGAYQSASISGLVTDDENRPLFNSVVWAEVIGEERGPHHFEIFPEGEMNADERSDVLAQDFNVTMINDSDVVIDHALVTGDELRNYGFEDFTGVQLSHDVDAMTLLTFPSEQEGEAQYTLPRVPALDIEDGIDHQLAGMQFQSNERGTSTAAGLPGITDDANIVIETEPLPVDFQIDDVSMPTQVDKGSGYEVTVEVSNAGGAEDTQNISYQLIDVVTEAAAADDENITEDDYVLMEMSEEVTVGGGESEEVTFDLSADVPPAPSFVMSDAYRQDVAVADANVSENLEVSGPSYALLGHSAQSRVEEGQTMQFDYNIQNNGNTNDSVTVTLDIGEGEIVEETTFTLRPQVNIGWGSIEGVNVDLDPGDHNFTITEADSGTSVSGVLTVEEAEEETPEPTPMPTPTPDEPTPTPTPSDDQPGFGLIIALMAILGAALLARRRYQG